jgi:hypothetical protein
MTTTALHLRRADDDAPDRVADRIAANLADPEDVYRRLRLNAWWVQSLATGALGAALLHVHRASTGRAGWRTAHTWLAVAAARSVDDGPGSHLHYGAPALAYVLHHASADHPETGRTRRYARALETLDARIALLTRARVDAAHRRIDRGDTPALGEFDAIRGLTGLGALWLRRDPTGPQLRAILEYLVRLTEPSPDPDGRPRPGWWTHLAPNGHRTPEFPDGHANNGLSHGIAGPLALLALTLRAGHHVPGHDTALRRILDWYDTCQHTHHPQPGDPQVWWPYWTTNLADPRTGPGRPSWCYGTPGIARAQQLAGIALDDPHRIHTAETALHAAITAPDLIRTLDNPGLCHGLAGALLITRRAAADSTSRRLRDHVTRLRQVTAEAADLGSSLGEPGLFDGLAGIALALDDEATLHGQEWDACLLTS